MKRMIDADELIERIKDDWPRDPHQQARIYQIIGKINQMLKENENDTSQ